MSSASTAVLLLTVAMVVALLARRIRVPYTVALVVVGLMLGAVQAFPAPHLTRDLLYSTLLPGLLFEAAFQLDARDFWRNKAAILILAVPGVALAIAVATPLLVVASSTLGLASGFAWPAALVFAALIAATDPIAVIALFRSVGAPLRLAVIVDGESLVNDGTAVVFYSIAVGIASRDGASALGASLAFARVVGLGVLVGAGIGFVISRVIARVDDPLVATTLTTIAAYGSFLLAERLGASGVLATVAAAMVCGSYGAPRTSAATRVAVGFFWQYAAFTLNSIVFLLIGLEIRGTYLLDSWREILVAYVVVMATRAGIVFLTLALLRRTRERIDWDWGLVLAWGGVRGALSMVLALALAESFPDRVVVIRVTFGVVLLSILVNGPTLAPLLRLLRIAAMDSGMEKKLPV